MIANYHTHTWRCNHAAGTEEEYIRCAKEAGMKILGFADHSPYIFHCDYYSTFRMTMDQLDGYVDTVLALRKQHPEMDLPLGFEMEYYPGMFTETVEVLWDHPVDYLILGQHFLGNEIGEAYGAAATGDLEMLKRYCLQSMEGLNTGLFTYFAHPDLLNYQGDRKVYQREIRWLCREAKSIGIPLEINLLGFREGRCYPNRAFWEVAAEEGCQAILGVDAHSPQVLNAPEIERRGLSLAREFCIQVLNTLELRAIR